METPAEPKPPNSSYAQISEEFAALSGLFRKPEDYKVDLLASNDRGLSKIVPRLAEDFKGREPGGLGLVVGSGTFSFLPEVKVQPIILDKNPRVLRASEKLCDLIISHDSPSAVIEKLRFPQGTGQSSDVKGEIMAHMISDEAESFGQYHWTNPYRFEAVQRELTERRPTWVLADLTVPELAEKFNEITDRHGKIIYANLTNVHSWMVGVDPRPIMESLPFDPFAGIVFSMYNRAPGEPYHFPDAYYRKSIEEYLYAIEGHQNRM